MEEKTSNWDEIFRNLLKKTTTDSMRYTCIKVILKLNTLQDEINESGVILYGHIKRME